MNKRLCFRRLLIVICSMSTTYSISFAQGEAPGDGSDDRGVGVYVHLGQSMYDLAGPGQSLIISSEVVVPMSGPFDLNVAMTFLPTYQDHDYGSIQTSPNTWTIDMRSVYKPYLLLDVQPQVRYTTLGDRLDLFAGTGLTLGAELADNEFREPFEDRSRLFLELLFTGGVRFGIGEHLSIGVLGRMRYGALLRIGSGFPGDSLDWSFGLGWVL